MLLYRGVEDVVVVWVDSGRKMKYMVGSRVEGLFGLGSPQTLAKPISKSEESQKLNEVKFI